MKPSQRRKISATQCQAYDAYARVSLFCGANSLSGPRSAAQTCSNGPKKLKKSWVSRSKTQKTAVAGWWFGTCVIFHIIYGMSSFPLTYSIIFQAGYCTTNQLWKKLGGIFFFDSSQGFHQLWRGWSCWKEDRTLISRSLESWFLYGTSSPFMAARFRLVIFFNLSSWLIFHWYKL